MFVRVDEDHAVLIEQLRIAFEQDFEVPLVLASLITGIASLSDLQKLSRIGGKTVILYIGTTLVALIIGLTIVNIFDPGETVPEDRRQGRNYYER